MDDVIQDYVFSEADSTNEELTQSERTEILQKLGHVARNRYRNWIECLSERYDLEFPDDFEVDLTDDNFMRKIEKVKPMGNLDYTRDDEELRLATLLSNFKSGASSSSESSSNENEFRSPTPEPYIRNSKNKAQKSMDCNLNTSGPNKLNNCIGTTNNGETEEIRQGEKFHQKIEPSQELSKPTTPDLFKNEITLKNSKNKNRTKETQPHPKLQPITEKSEGNKSATPDQSENLVTQSDTISPNKYSPKTNMGLPAFKQFPKTVKAEFLDSNNEGHIEADQQIQKSHLNLKDNWTSSVSNKISNCIGVPKKYLKIKMSQSLGSSISDQTTRDAMDSTEQKCLLFKQGAVLKATKKKMSVSVGPVALENKQECNQVIDARFEPSGEIDFVSALDSKSAPISKSNTSKKAKNKFIGTTKTLEESKCDYSVPNKKIGSLLSEKHDGNKSVQKGMHSFSGRNSESDTEAKSVTSNTTQYLSLSVPKTRKLNRELNRDKICVPPLILSNWIGVESLSKKFSKWKLNGCVQSTSMMNSEEKSAHSVTPLKNAKVSEMLDEVVPKHPKFIVMKTPRAE